jgi:hypothetical protein
MLMRFFRFLYGDIPVEVPSLFSLQDSVQHLRDFTKRSVFSSLFSQAAVGRVTATDVRLQRVIPMFGNSFKPIFVGKFQEINGHVVLKGKFTMFLFSKIFMSIWLGFALFWTILASLSIFSTSGVRTTTPVENPLLASMFPLIGIAFFLGGILFVRFCWWLSRSDMKYLTKVMTQALQGQAGSPLDAPQAARP